MLTNQLLPLPERSSCLSPSLVGVSSSKPSTWLDAAQGEGSSVSPLCPVPPTSLSRSPASDAGSFREKTNLLKWWGWRRIRRRCCAGLGDCPMVQLRVPPGGSDRASERQGTKANEAVIMLKTIMALLWELLKQTSQGSN